MTPQPREHATEAAPARRRRLLIPLAALLAVMPLIHHGCSCGHDFDFHLLNWMEAARQFSHGNLHPHWAFTPAFNAGEPRFVFYPPVSWYLGAVLGLILTHIPGVSEAAAWSATPILFTWIALTAAGLTLYRLARLYAAPNAALLAAIIYLANPYMLFTAYERTAYAELLAAAWIPLLFHAILRDRVTIPQIALPIALLWLTNAPAAVMGTYTLAILVAIRILSAYRSQTGVGNAETDLRPWLSRHAASLQLTSKTIAGTALGLALATFYIIPAEFERRFVQIAMATIAGMRIDQNFLFEHTGTSSDELLHDQVLHTASCIAIILLLATAIALAAIMIRKKHRTGFPVLSLAILTAGIAFSLTPISLPLWNHTPQATFLQFPWRLLGILAPIFALATGAALDRLSLKLVPTVLAGFLIVVALSHSAYHFFRQPCDPEDTAPARLALFHSNDGTDPTDEYTPATADNDALATHNPPYWLAQSLTEPPPAGALPGPAPMHFAVTAPNAEALILNLRGYPAWQILRNGVPQSAPASRPDGLIAIHLPAGQSTIDVRYAHTFDQTFGDATTVLAFAIFLFTIRRNIPAHR
jgi:predicted membrane channel-forming protein YqfA (hemolysin III family)